MSTVIERVKNNDTTLWIPVSFNAIIFAVENLELIRPENQKTLFQKLFQISQIFNRPKIFFICDPSASSFVPMRPNKYKNMK